MTRPALPDRGADLHVHTTHSDGSCSPGEVVRAAFSVGLSALAITDHDTLSALDIARPEADRLGLKLISGVELSCDLDGREIHILGHFFDPDCPDLIHACSRLRSARDARVRLMADALEKQGLHVDLDALRRLFPRAALGRRHLADWLTQTRQVSSRRDVFTLYLADGAPASIPKPLLPWTEALSLLRAAGGTSALAHPPRNLRRDTLEQLARSGLTAIEVNGPGIGRPHQTRFRLWADELALIPIAGSDFHAPDRPGSFVGSISTPLADLHRLNLARPADLGRPPNS